MSNVADPFVYGLCFYSDGFLHSDHKLCGLQGSNRAVKSDVIVPLYDWITVQRHTQFDFDTSA